MAKVCFTTIVFNDEYFLEAVLTSLIPHGTVIVAEGPIAHWQKRGFTTSTDRTNEILHDILPEWQIVHLQASTKNDLANAALRLVPDDTTHVWAVDADEMYRQADMRNVIGRLDNLDSVSFKAYAFYGGFDRYVTGFDETLEVQRIKRFYPGAQWTTHRPPTMLNPDTGRPWREARHLDYETLSADGIRMFHFNRVLPKQVKAKEDFYYTRAPSRTIKDYFERVYIPWVQGDIERVEETFNGVHNFHPSVRDSSFTRKFTGTLPRVMEDSREYYERMIEYQMLDYYLEEDAESLYL